ncbi:Hypothetical predicted protein [Lecanosticta acicola]|uniref:Uncharacterized protein n=1 Tax=Lecanosticta acicola TaxID=111012 RepID=A0AAI8YYI6_9PEZI|nr:Hypothetical predicted protein [Lecanosticta acicola]
MVSRLVCVAYCMADVLSLARCYGCEDRIASKLTQIFTAKPLVWVLIGLGSHPKHSRSYLELGRTLKCNRLYLTALRRWQHRCRGGFDPVQEYAVIADISEEEAKTQIDKMDTWGNETVEEVKRRLRNLALAEVPNVEGHECEKKTILTSFINAISCCRPRTTKKKHQTELFARSIYAGFTQHISAQAME